MLLLNTPVLAEEESPPYSIAGYSSDIVLNPDGSVYFNETITYKLLQESVQIVNPIPMGNSSKEEGVEVFLQLQNAASDESETDKELQPVQNYTFELADENQDIYHITIPYEGKKQDEVTFVYRYKMLDTVFLYKDTAVFFWRYLFPDQVKDIQNIFIQISMPGVTSVDDWRGYVRGAVYAKKELLEDGKFQLTVEKLQENEYLESVLLLPLSLFPEGRKVIDNNAEEEILSEMGEWEDQALLARKKDELKYYSGWAVGIIAMLISIGTGVLCQLKSKIGMNIWIIGATILSLVAGILVLIALKNYPAGILAVISSVALIGYTGFNLYYPRNSRQSL